MRVILSAPKNLSLSERKPMNIKKTCGYLLMLVVSLIAIASPARAQTEVTLLAPNPFRGVLQPYVAGFEAKTGYKLKLTLGRGLGTREQVARGEMYDVSILLPPYPEALASGNIDPKSATT